MTRNDPVVPERDPALTPADQDPQGAAPTTPTGEQAAREAGEDAANRPAETGRHGNQDDGK